jgi:hypothetical protein
LVSCFDGIGEEIPLDGIGTDTTSITFHTLLHEHVGKGNQAFLQHDDGSLSAL